MIEFEQAVELILKNTPILEKEIIPIEQSIGRILKEDIYATIEMPPFDKSAMDGYALIAKDTQNAPVKLKCIGFIQAGDIFSKPLKRGECVKIMTGAKVPQNADSIIMVENTREKNNYVEILKESKKSKNICFRGEDIQKGICMLKKNTPIYAPEVSLLASLGKKTVKVGRKPVVGVLNTGGELETVGKKLGKNKIYNSNGPLLSSLLDNDYIKYQHLGIVKDNIKQLKNATEKGLKNDILLISGGVSMGDYDFVPEVLNMLKVKKIFHKVSVKPGKPIFFGKRNKTIVFGIPGNPVSNFLAYHIFIRLSIYKMMGYNLFKSAFKEGILEKEVTNKKGRTHFVMVRITPKNNNFYLMPLPSHGSADVVSLARADGFMMLDKNISNFGKKTRVPFFTWK